MARVGVLVAVFVALFVVLASTGVQADICPLFSSVSYPPSCPRSTDYYKKTTCCTKKNSAGQTFGSCCDVNVCLNADTGRTYHCPKTGTSEDQSLCCTKVVDGQLKYTCCDIYDLGWKVWLIVGGAALAVIIFITCCICCCCSCCCIAQRRQASGGYVIVR